MIDLHLIDTSSSLVGSKCFVFFQKEKRFYVGFFMVRFNTLKISIIAGEAKPGGLIGATLSPYLFSANMADFCKKFNDFTKDIESGLPLLVIIKCDVVEKTYSFFIKSPQLIVLYDQYRIAYNSYEFFDFDILFLFDFVYMISQFYNTTLRKAASMLFSYMYHCHYKIMVNFDAMALRKV